MTQDYNAKGCARLVLAVMQHYFYVTPKGDRYENEKRYKIMKNFYENADEFIDHACEALEWDIGKFKKRMKMKLDQFKEQMK